MEEQISLDALLDELDRDVEEAEKEQEREKRKRAGGSRVSLNVYDMVKVELVSHAPCSPSTRLRGREMRFLFFLLPQVSLNNYTSWCGIGAFHSGVHVYDKGKQTRGACPGSCVVPWGYVVHMSMVI